MTACILDRYLLYSNPFNYFLTAAGTLFEHITTLGARLARRIDDYYASIMTRALVTRPRAPSCSGGPYACMGPGGRHFLFHTPAQSRRSPWPLLYFMIMMCLLVHSFSPMNFKLKHVSLSFHMPELQLMHTSIQYILVSLRVSSSPCVPACNTTLPCTFEPLCYSRVLRLPPTARYFSLTPRVRATAATFTCYINAV